MYKKSVILFNAFLLSIFILISGGCGGGSNNGGMIFPTSTPGVETLVMGKVTEVSGNPIGGAYLICNDNNTSRYYLNTTSDAGGNYSLTGLSPGACRIEMWRSKTDCDNDPGNPVGAVNVMLVQGINTVNVIASQVAPTPTPPPGPNATATPGGPAQVTPTPTRTPTPTTTLPPTLLRVLDDSGDVYDPANNPTSVNFTLTGTDFDATQDPGFQVTFTDVQTGTVYTATITVWSNTSISGNVLIPGGKYLVTVTTGLGSSSQSIYYYKGDRKSVV